VDYPCDDVCISQTILQGRGLRIANDERARIYYDMRVSKTRPKRYTNWYLRAWMEHLGVNQAKLVEKTDYSKATISLLVNDQQDYNPTYVRDMSRALNIAPFELFMHPDDAAALKRLMAEAETTAALGKRLHLVVDKEAVNGGKGEQAPTMTRRGGE